MASKADTLLIAGPVGSLEVLALPQQLAANPAVVAIICHPHPLHGGTMHNKVVTTAAQACQELGISTVRFNFRGIGQSVGDYANGCGEQDDLLAVIAWVKQLAPDAELVLLGFSFGAYIAASVAAQVAVKALILIAPAVNNFPFQPLTISCPVLVIQGEQDEIVSCSAVQHWLHSLNNVNCTAIIFPQTGHFFHGKIVTLRATLTEQIAQLICITV